MSRICATEGCDETIKPRGDGGRDERRLYCSSLCKNRSHYHRRRDYVLAKNKRFQQENPWYGLTRAHGLTVDEAKAAWALRDSCAICGSSERLHYDHCHATGKFRAWLCAMCNGGLGLFRDKPDILREAALYVERHRDGG